MKIQKIALAVSLALSATSVFAGSNVATGVATANIYYVGGASAQTPGLSAAIKSMCAGTFTTYTDSTGTVNFAYKCSSGTAASPASGLPFIVQKNDEGSSRAATQTTMHQGLAFLDLTNVDVAASIPTAVQASNIPDNVVSGVTTSSFGGTAGTNLTYKAQFSLTDVNTTFWRARPVTMALDSTYTLVSNFSGQGFGLAVSDKLYKLLQADQGLTVGATDGANQPSITKSAMASLMAGTSAVWQNLTPNLVRNLSSVTLNASTLPTTLQYARRSSTSGTQVSAEMYFLNTTCAGKTGLLGSTPTNSTVTNSDTSLSTSASNNAVAQHTTTYTVTAATNTGAVKNILEAVQGTLGATSEYTFGVMSLENAQPANDDNSNMDWKWVKIDGKSPNFYSSRNATTGVVTPNVYDAYQKLNVVNGVYDFAFESEMVIPKSDPNVVATPTAIVDTANPAISFAKSIATYLANGNNLTNATGIFSTSTAPTDRVEGQTNHFSRSNNACKASTMTWTVLK